MVEETLCEECLRCGYGCEVGEERTIMNVFYRGWKWEQVDVIRTDAGGVGTG